MKSFDEIVGKAYERLPEWIRTKVKNVALLVEDVPDAETVKELELQSNMELLGFYRGVPRTVKNNDESFTMPDSIVLYKLPIEDEAKMTGKSVEDVAYETLWHEIGHHFGLDEDDIQKREKEEFE
jgi:predicted Zn-dependent protease with MMP-like domain